MIDIIQGAIVAIAACLFLYFYRKLIPQKTQALIDFLLLLLLIGSTLFVFYIRDIRSNKVKRFRQSTETEVLNNETRSVDE